MSLITLALSLVAFAGLANAELSAIEREKLHLCPKNCAPYCEEIPGKHMYMQGDVHRGSKMTGSAASMNKFKHNQNTYR